MPRVSVILPYHNNRDSLPKAVGSVLTQTYRDFEVIVVDDASSEPAAAVLGCGGSRVRCLPREANGGVSAARNDGIRASTGDLIAFLDSDDLYLPRRLEHAVAFLDHNPSLQAVHGDCEVRGPGGQVLRSSLIAASGCRKRLLTWRDIARHEPVHTNTITVRRRCLEEVGLFDEGLRRGQDSEMWLRLSHRHPIAQLPHVVAIWHRRETRWRSEVIARRAIGVWEGVLAWLPEAEAADLRFARAELARAYWRLALGLESDRDLEAARARRQAAGYCLSTGLAGHLLAGMACCAASAVWARARGACVRMGRRASRERRATESRA